MSRLLFAWVVCVLLASQGRALNLNMLKQSAGAFSSSLLDLADTKLGVQYIQVSLGLGGHLLGCMVGPGASMLGH